MGVRLSVIAEKSTAAQVRVCGWGFGEGGKFLKVGDLLEPEYTSRILIPGLKYRIAEIRYFVDPHDMWAGMITPVD